MKSLLTVFFSCIFLFLSNSPEAQELLSQDQWIEDLEYLKDKVNQDYPFLFKKVSQEDWNNKADQLITSVPNLAPHQIKVGIAELIALFGYGHTALWLSGHRHNEKIGFHQMPFNLYWFSDGVFIQGVHKNYEKALGAKVLKVGNMSIEDAIEAVYPVVSAENEQFFKAYGINYLGTAEVLQAKGIINQMDKVNLTLEKDGETFEMSFEHIPIENYPNHYGFVHTEQDWLDSRTYENTPNWLKDLHKIYYYEFLEEHKALYIRQSQIQNEEDKDIATFYAEVFDFIENNPVEKLIIDVRLNGGGNNYNNKPVILGLIKSEKVNQAGKLFVIIGRRTFSACQNLVNEIENYTNALFVGEPTGENVNFYGDVRSEVLPNSEISIRLSHMWWQDKDPRDARPWTAPDVAVDLSSNDYFSNRDPVLETILTQEGFEKAKDPMQHLQELFEAGRTRELQEAAFRYINDPKLKYYDFEGRINEAGYSLLGIGQIEQAIGVFGFNTQLFPDSPKVWYSFAEAQWRAGNTEMAIQLFNKAIQMDPEGEVGRNAQKMLERIENKR